MTPVEVSSKLPLKPLTEDSVVVSLVVSINDQSSLFSLANPHCCWIWVLFPLVHHHGSKMLRSESNSSITQSPIGWQISQILTQLHEPTGGMCVCTSECVPLCAGCTAVAVRVCERSSWMASSRATHQPSVTPLWFFMHAVFCVGHTSGCCRACNSLSPALACYHVFLICLKSNRSSDGCTTHRCTEFRYLKLHVKQLFLAALVWEIWLIVIVPSSSSWRKKKQNKGLCVKLKLLIIISSCMKTHSQAIFHPVWLILMLFLS